MKSSFVLAAIAVSVIGLATQTPGQRPIQVSDIYRIKSVRDPQISPDGNWVAYTVGTIDSAAVSDMVLIREEAFGVARQRF